MVGRNVWFWAGELSMRDFVGWMGIIMWLSLKFCKFWFKFNYVQIHKHNDVRQYPGTWPPRAQCPRTRRTDRCLPARTPSRPRDAGCGMSSSSSPQLNLPKIISTCKWIFAKLSLPLSITCRYFMLFEIIVGFVFYLKLKHHLITIVTILSIIKWTPPWSNACDAIS